MTFEEFFDAVRRFGAATHPAAAPREIVLKYHDGTEATYTVPITVPTLPVPPPAPEPVASLAPATLDEGEVEQAIITLLVDTGERLTTGVIQKAISDAHQGEPGFSAENIAKTLSRMKREGKLDLASKSEGEADGMGKGYGLPDWRKNNGHGGSN